MSLQTKPYILHDDREKMLSLDATVSVLANSEQSDGAFNVFDVIYPPGYETQLHIHYSEDVAIYILEGDLDIFWGDEKKQATTGSFVFQPRGTPHGFRAKGLMGAHILYMTFPAGFDKFVIGCSKPGGASESRLSEARFKIEVLGPLPE
jgi:quercetin dioxygenase-like cupin family protein